MKFKIYWLDKKTEIVEEETIQDAFTHAGYGTGAVRAIDYFEPLKKEVIQKENQQKEKYYDYEL